MSGFRPPREGITLEYLLRPIRGILLQPILLAALLLASWKRPDHTQRYLSLIPANAIGLETYNLALKALLVAGLAYRLNQYLSRKAVNNFQTDNTWDWSREIVVVTGGGSGIGKEIVRQFGARNIRVVILDINPPQWPLPPSVFFYRVDVTSSEDVQEVAQRIREDVGNPTVLINNAGIGSGKTMLDETPEELQQTFNVNILAHFRLVKEFVPYMITQNHGHILTIASMASFVCVAGNVSYSATKAAALAFHEGLAQELKARYGANRVRTTVVHPFWVKTPLTKDLVSRKEWKEFTLEPETVADAVVSQVLKGESAQLILPARFGFAAAVRSWPSWLQEFVRDSSAHLLPEQPA